MCKIITLANLAESTEQEVFDHVAKHLLKQGAKALDDNHQCVYRNMEGLKCAAGCLMSEGEYNRNFEGDNWNGLLFGYKVPEAHSSLIKRLQSIHDDEDVDEWPMELRNVASYFHLKMIGI